MPKLMLVPSPVPLPVSFVVKKGFKDLIFHRRQSLPVPVSETRASTALCPCESVTALVVDGQHLLAGPVRSFYLFVHGVNGIGHKVDKHLLQPIVLGPDLGQIRCQIQRHL